MATFINAPDCIRATVLLMPVLHGFAKLYRVQYAQSQLPRKTAPAKP
jgi:hypothetical protein